MDTITTIPSLLKCNGSAQPVTVALTPSETRLIAAAPENYDANKLSLRNVESLLYKLPQGGDGAFDSERKSLETWAKILRAAIAKAAEGGK